MLRILGISGSLRRGSHNTNLLRAAAELLPPGVELEVYEGLEDLPPYDADRDVEPGDPAVARLREAIASRRRATAGAAGSVSRSGSYGGSSPRPS